MAEEESVRIIQRMRREIEEVIRIHKNGTILKVQWSQNLKISYQTMLMPCNDMVFPMLAAYTAVNDTIAQSPGIPYAFCEDVQTTGTEIWIRAQIHFLCNIGLESLKKHPFGIVT